MAINLIYLACLSASQRVRAIIPGLCASVPQVAALSALPFPLLVCKVAIPFSMSARVACPLTHDTRMEPGPLMRSPSQKICQRSPSTWRLHTLPHGFVQLWNFVPYVIFQISALPIKKLALSTNPVLSLPICAGRGTRRPRIPPAISFRVELVQNPAIGPHFETPSSTYLSC